VPRAQFVSYQRQLHFDSATLSLQRWAYRVRLHDEGGTGHWLLCCRVALKTTCCFEDHGHKGERENPVRRRF